MATEYRHIQPHVEREAVENTGNHTSINSKDPDTQLAVYREHLEGIVGYGRNYRAISPFHNDHKPSFRLDRKDGAWLWFCDPCKGKLDIWCRPASAAANYPHGLCREDNFQRADSVVQSRNRPPPLNGNPDQRGGHV